MNLTKSFTAVDASGYERTVNVSLMTEGEPHSGQYRVEINDDQWAAEYYAIETVALQKAECLLADYLEATDDQVSRSEETKISKGDFVSVKPHTTYGDLRGGAVHSTMHEHKHHGYKRVKVHSIADDGSVEVELSNGDVDVVDIQYIEKL